jgi:hypothetical protein
MEQLDEKKGASKGSIWKKGNMSRGKENEKLDDAKSETDDTVKGRKAEPNTKQKINKQSDYRKGTTKLKEEMMSEQMNDFVNAVARDDYSKTKSMLSDIVRSKMDQRTQQEVDKIRAEQE